MSRNSFFFFLQNERIGILISLLFSLCQTEFRVFFSHWPSCIKEIKSCQQSKRLVMHWTRKSSTIVREDFPILMFNVSAISLIYRQRINCVHERTYLRCQYNYKEYARVGLRGIYTKKHSEKRVLIIQISNGKTCVDRNGKQTQSSSSKGRIFIILHYYGNKQHKRIPCLR